MAESPTTEVQSQPVQPQQGVTPDQVQAQIDLNNHLKDLVSKFTGTIEFQGENDKPDPNKVKAFTMAVRGAYTELMQKGIDVGPGQEVSHENVFEEVFQTFTGHKFGEEPSPSETTEVTAPEEESRAQVKQPQGPPGTQATPSQQFVESAATEVLGAEGASPEDFPLHDPQKYMQMRHAHRDRLRTPLSTVASTKALEAIVADLNSGAES